MIHLGRYAELLEWMGKLAFLAVILWSMLFFQAAMAEELTQQQALELGRQVGKSASTDYSLPSVTPESLPGFVTGSPSEMRYHEQGIALEDTARSILYTEKPVSPVGSLLNSINNRPTFTIDRDDPLVKHTDQLIADADKDSTTGGTNCKTLTVKDPDKTGTDTCMEYLVVEDKTCKRSLSLTCSARQEANAGIVNRGTVPADIAWSYNYPNMLIGTVGDNYWRTGVYDRTTTFTVSNIENIKSATLTHAWFDDWLHVTVNGTTVYVGPRGGDRLDVDTYTKRCTDWCFSESPTRTGSWLLANGYVKQDGSYIKKPTQAECSSYFFGFEYCSEPSEYWDSTNGMVCYTDTLCSTWELSKSWDIPLNINIRPYLKTGSNSITMRTVVAGRGEGVINLDIRQWAGCTAWSDTWTDECAVLASDPGCEKRSSQCIDSKNPRTIEGISVNRNCWVEQDTYQCYGTRKGADDYCAELRDAGCTQSSSTCNESLYGRCVAWEQTYQCNIAGKTREVEDCSAASVCLDGNCFDSGYEANTDFGVAASYLGAAESMATDLNPDTLDIFKGLGMSCEQKPLGFKNCCKDSGWGLDIGFSECSETDKELALKRAAGFCHYVGDYKKGTVFKTRYKTWCCFNSKLARIIHEQGRPYIPLGWGNGKSPECRGMTPEELQKIDFGKIDFSEFFADALANADAAIKPSSGDLSKALEDRIKRLLPQ